VSPDLGFGLLSALANAVGGILSRDLAIRLPPRQLIGPLFALNAIVVSPFALFIDGHLGPTTVILHGISVLLLIVTSVAVWDLFAHGDASATITAQSISPLPAALAVAVLLPATLEAVQVAAAILVVLGVLGALSRAFGPLSRRRSIVTILVAASGTGLVTVMGRLRSHEAAPVLETLINKP
jgi:drug/metabolite transporter (DMT)-like permease